MSQDADVIVTDLASAIKQIFPTVPLKYIIRKVNALGGFALIWCTIIFNLPLNNRRIFLSSKVEIQPSDRETIFSDELRPSDPRNVGPCGGFSRQYACMCDFHGIAYRYGLILVDFSTFNRNLILIFVILLYRDEVAWDIDTIYLSHDTRILNLRDFDHLEPK